MYARMFSKDLFDKFKDKSASVQKATHEALMNFKQYCITLDDMQEPIQGGCGMSRE